MFDLVYVGFCGLDVVAGLVVVDWLCRVCFVIGCLTIGVLSLDLAIIWFVAAFVPRLFSLAWVLPWWIVLLVW